VIEEKQIQVIAELQASDILAFNFTNAARVVGLSYDSIHREIIRGHLRPLTTYKLIAKTELLRWLTNASIKKPSARKAAAVHRSIFETRKMQQLA
jgi:hypothetical protein